jgi:kumamolisin
MTQRKLVVLPGSHRETALGTQLGPSDPNEVFKVTVTLRSKASAQERQDILSQISSRLAKPLTREEFADNFGARAADIKRIQHFAHNAGLAIESADLASRHVTLVGTVAAFERAFSVKLSNRQHPTGEVHRARSGALKVPAGLASCITGVFGLDNRPQARTRRRFLRRSESASAGGKSISYTGNEVADIYQFPESDGAGQCFALIELGGGYTTSSINSYFDNLGINPPNVVAVSVDGATNSPGNPNGADGEVMLDILVAGAIAPAATILVVFAPNSDSGFLNAITTAMQHPSKPTGISISWGGPEDSWTSQALTEFNQVFEEASTMGITVTAAAGDGGSTDGNDDGRQHCDFPASSPYVLACGGTTLESSDGEITSETVWNSDGGGTGGGISDVFPVPSYQDNTALPPSANPGAGSGRGMPDIAGVADPNTGYSVIVDGESIVVGGTSAVAPMAIGLIMRLNQILPKPVGFIHPLLYQNGESVCRDVTEGNNGAYSAGPGWDCCTGFGSMIGTQILAALDGEAPTPPPVPSPTPTPPPTPTPRPPRPKPPRPPRRSKA